MKYGLPYMGSKNAIAPYIVNALPPATNFYDLFCGGGAITHCALYQHKYKNYIINDLNKDITELFMDAINGKFKDEKRWISREDFFKLKDSEPYVAYCWSFGNSGKAYLYGKYIEPWKKALHYARVLNDPTLLQKMEIYTDASRSDIKKHEKEFKQKYIEWYKKNYCSNDEDLEYIKNSSRLETLQSLESLESLERLQRLERLERFNLSYEKVPIKPNSVLYCDIPYEDTASYVIGAFNHKAFYDWACNQKELVVISSYKISDNRFIEIDCIKKRSLLGSASQKEGKENYEKLFIPIHQKELYEKMMGRKLLEIEHYEQLTLF